MNGFLSGGTNTVFQELLALRAPTSTEHVEFAANHDGGRRNAPRQREVDTMRKAVTLAGDGAVKLALCLGMAMAIFQPPGPVLAAGGGFGSIDSSGMAYANGSGTERISASFENTSVREALMHLESLSGVAITYHRATLPQTNVDVRFSNIRFEMALDTILDNTNLVWERDDEGVHVREMTEEMLAQHSRLPGYEYGWDDWDRLDRYDRDDFRRDTRRGRRDRPAATPAPTLHERADGLVRLIQHVVEPGSWREREEVEEGEEEEPADIW